MRNPSRKRAASVFCTLVLALLCACVVVQMLGVPATLLDPAAASDTLGNSVLEGFSVPPSVIEIRPLTKAQPVTDILHVFTRPLLITVPFHPPVPTFFG